MTFAQQVEAQARQLQKRCRYFVPMIHGRTHCALGIPYPHPLPCFAREWVQVGTPTCPARALLSDEEALAEARSLVADADAILHTVDQQRGKLWHISEN